ncbi:hypothetical protein GGG16DRAFT_125854 [Schizophyllum commune]
MQRRAPQARGDGGASSALRWALHLHVASTPCSTLETDAPPGIRLRIRTPPGAPSPTTLAPPPIDAAPHLQRCPPPSRQGRSRSLPKVSCNVQRLRRLRSLHPSNHPGAHDLLFTRTVSIDDGLKIRMPHLCRTSLVLFQSRFLLNAQRRQHLSRCRNLSQSSAASMGSCGSYSWIPASR